MKDRSVQVNLKCDVCGNDQFSAIEESLNTIDLSDIPDNGELKCSDCGRIITKEQLLEENEYIINTNFERLKKDTVKDLEKDLKKTLKRFK